MNEFLNLLRLVFLTVFCITIILCYTVTSLSITRFLVHDLLKISNHFLYCVIYLSIVCLFIFFLKKFAITKMIKNRILGDTLFLIVGMVIAVYSITMKNMNLQGFVNDHVEMISWAEAKMRKMFSKLKKQIKGK